MPILPRYSACTKTTKQRHRVRKAIRFRTQLLHLQAAGPLPSRPATNLVHAMGVTCMLCNLNLPRVVVFDPGLCISRVGRKVSVSDQPRVSYSKPVDIGFCTVSTAKDGKSWALLAIGDLKSYTNPVPNHDPDQCADPFSLFRSLLVLVKSRSQLHTFLHTLITS